MIADLVNESAMSTHYYGHYGRMINVSVIWQQPVNTCQQSSSRTYKYFHSQKRGDFSEHKKVDEMKCIRWQMRLNFVFSSTLYAELDWDTSVLCINN